MKRLLFLGIALLLLFLSACSQPQPQQPGISQEEERRLLEQAAREYLKSTQNTTQDSGSQPVPLSEAEWQEDGNEEIYTEDTETVQNDDSESRPASDSSSVSSSSVDIRIRDVDIRYERSFDLESDEVRFEVDITASGLEEDEFFIVEVLMRRTGVDTESCSFIYRVGGDEDDHMCEIDDLEEYGTYDIEVYADTRVKYEDSDLSNNIFRDEIKIEED